MSEFNLLDTLALDHFLESKDSILQRYSDIQTRYNKTVSNLLVDWKGRGADAFEEDANAVTKNLSGINDILKTMCDTLYDCREIFRECDTAIGNNNANAFQGKKQ